MSVSQFPNATIAKADELQQLCDKLVPNIDPAIEDDYNLIFAAHMCAMVEQVVQMSKLPLYHKLDPSIMRQIRSVLNSCR